MELAGAVAMEQLNRLSREAEEELGTAEGRGLELTSWEVEALAREAEATDAAERLRVQLAEEERLRKQLEEEKRREMEALERDHLQRLAAAAASAAVAAAVAAEEAVAEAADETATQAVAAEAEAAAAAAAAAETLQTHTTHDVTGMRQSSFVYLTPVAVVEQSAVFSVLDFSTRDAVAAAAKAVGGGGGPAPGAGGGGGVGGSGDAGLPLLGADSPATPARAAGTAHESWGVTPSPLRLPRAGQPRPSPLRSPRLAAATGRSQLRLQVRPAGAAVSLPALLARRADMAAAFFRWKFANRACAAFAGICHAQRDSAPAQQVELMAAAKHGQK